MPLMCIYVENEMVTYLGDGERKARKEHCCHECKRTIDSGERYRFWTYVDLDMGGIETDKMCSHCWNTIELGAAFTGCPKAWYWGEIHKLRDPHGDGSFVADILGEHALTVAQQRVMVRCVRDFRRTWRGPDGALLPLVTAPVIDSEDGSNG